MKKTMTNAEGMTVTYPCGTRMVYDDYPSIFAAIESAEIMGFCHVSYYDTMGQTHYVVFKYNKVTNTATFMGRQLHFCEGSTMDEVNGKIAAETMEERWCEIFNFVK